MDMKKGRMKFPHRFLERIMRMLKVVGTLANREEFRLGLNYQKKVLTQIFIKAKPH